MNAVLEERIQGLIEALKEKQLQFYLNWDSTWDTNNAKKKFEQQQIEEPWKIKKGSKFIKIISGGSVHAFVEIATGKLIKPAGWSAPATKSNGELQSKYNLLEDESFEAVKEACDQYGSYLYARG